MMNQANLAAGSLLNTIANTANTVSNTVDTVNNAVAIANNYVKRNLILQQDKSVVMLDKARVQLLEDAAADTARRNAILSKELADPAFKACYDAAYARYAKALEGSK